MQCFSRGHGYCWSFGWIVCGLIAVPAKAPQYTVRAKTSQHRNLYICCICSFMWRHLCLKNTQFYCTVLFMLVGGRKVTVNMDVSELHSVSYLTSLCTWTVYLSHCWAKYAVIKLLVQEYSPYKMMKNRVYVYKSTVICNIFEMSLDNPEKKTINEYIIWIKQKEPE